MTLNFRVSIDESDAPSIFEKWAKLNKFPKDLKLTEYDILSMIRMSRRRNMELHKRMVDWYGKIDQKFRVV